MASGRTTLRIEPRTAAIRVTGPINKKEFFRLVGKKWVGKSWDIEGNCLMDKRIKCKQSWQG